MKQLFVVKDAGVGGRVHCVIGPTDYGDAHETLFFAHHRPKEHMEESRHMMDYMRQGYGRVLCSDTCGGPSSLATQRVPQE